MWLGRGNEFEVLTFTMRVEMGRLRDGLAPSWVVGAYCGYAFALQV